MGRPVHPARKTYNPEGGGRSALQEGVVYVRHQASTERANAADVDMLSRRAARRPGDQLAVDVRPAPETNLRAIDVSPDALEQFIGQEESNLLAPLSPLGRRRSGLPPYKLDLLHGVGGLGSREHRSEEQFRGEVSGYLDKLREELPGILPARSVTHGIARLKLEVVNNTDTTFTKVRVEAKLPPELWVTEWQNEVRSEAELPSPPRAYGQPRLSGLGLRHGISFASVIAPPGALAGPWRPDVLRRPDAVYVDYIPEDVRAQGVTTLPSVWLVIADPATQAVLVRWEATATNAERRLSGTITVPVQQPPASVEELMADLPEEDD